MLGPRSVCLNIQTARPRSAQPRARSPTEGLHENTGSVRVPFKSNITDVFLPRRCLRNTKNKPSFRLNCPHKGPWPLLHWKAFLHRLGPRSVCLNIQTATPRFAVPRARSPDCTETQQFVRSCYGTSYPHYDVPIKDLNRITYLI